MDEYKGRLSEDASLLNHYLGRYNRCRRREEELKRRRKDILSDFESPLRAINYDGMPHGSSSNVGSASLSLELDEINTRILEEIERMKKVCSQICAVINFLPSDSTERAVLELRYIDGYSWQKICEAEHITKTPATHYWRKGLYQLLEFAKVRAIVGDYRIEVDGQ